MATQKLISKLVAAERTLLTGAGNREGARRILALAGYTPAKIAKFDKEARR